MKKIKMIYFGLFLIGIFLVSSTYFSYAFFTSKNEVHGKLNIVVGTLEYKIESSDLQDNSIIVSSGDTKIITLSVKSLNDVVSKYELYYKLENDNDLVTVGFLEDSLNTKSGTLENYESKKVEVIIRNKSDSSQKIIFGVEGGLINNDLVLNDNKSSLVDYCSKEDIYTFDYTGGEQKFVTPCSGNYKVELWGASGEISGLGGYTSGNISVSSIKSLYVYVGGKGYNQLGGFNGGGNSGIFENSGSGGGGGATDMRLTNTKYRYVRDYLNGNTINIANHWIEIKVYDTNGKLISQGKPVTVSTGLLGTDIITDGNIDNTSWNGAGGTGLQYVEVDLEQEYEIGYVTVWHYYGDDRSYYDTKTVLFTEDHKDSEVLFDSGVSGTYVETASGKTHYNTNFTSLVSRIMVAAGASSGYYNVGHAGGLIGYDGYEPNYEKFTATGGTQINGGYVTDYIYKKPEDGVFGRGGNGSSSSSSGYGSGGGGGYYGGSGGNGAYVGAWSGGGGSSFISGHNGCDAIKEESTEDNIIHTGQPNHYSGLVFTNTVMIDGAGYQWTTEKGDTVVGMPTHDGTSTMIGNGGNGYAKITYLGK